MTSYVMLIVSILLDPEAPKNQCIVNIAFIQQSASDVRQKLQKTEGFTGANIDQLISIEAKVVANREEMAKREKEKYLDKKAKILALALKEGVGKTRGWKRHPNRRDRRNPLVKNQCAYCKEEGHWKNERPNKKKKEKRKSDNGCHQIQGSLQPRDKHSLGRRV
jgi:hypothetical protein